MPRQTDDMSLQDFTVDSSEREGKFATKKTQCKHCGWSCVGIQRQRRYGHAKQCKKMDPDRVEEYRQQYQILYGDGKDALGTFPPKKRPQNPSARDGGSDSDHDSSQKRRSSGPMSSFCDRITRTEQEALDLAFAEMVLKTGLPFSLGENPAFQAFIKKLRPSNTLPSRRKIAGPLLKTVYERAQALVNQ